MECINCKKEFLTDWRKYSNNKPKFCSRKCSNSRSWDNEHKLKLSISCKNSEKVKLANILQKNKQRKKIKSLTFCSNCKIEVIKSNTKYCKECYSKYFAGGYREGSGRCKVGFYNGIFCNSTYELVWIIYNLQNKTNFKRCDFILKDEKTTYIPDFLLIDTNEIIEIKGFVLDKEKLKNKINLAISKGYGIKVLYKEDLKKEFEYVKLNYQYNRLEELYDNFKPEFNYICDICKKSFYRFKQIKGNIKLCSRSCSGKNVSKLKKLKIK